MPQSIFKTDLQYFGSIHFVKTLMENRNVVFDLDAPFTKMSFKNRMVIVTSQGPLMLTIPIVGGRDQKTPIKDISIAYDIPWCAQHLKSINTTLYDEFLFNIDVYGVKENIVPIRKSSEQASRDFGNHFFDLIIIDASHDYDSVLNDIKFWISKVKKGGILAGDDYDEKFPNVKKAVNDYFGYGNINIIGNTWFKIV